MCRKTVIVVIFNSHNIVTAPLLITKINSLLRTIKYEQKNQFSVVEIKKQQNDAIKVNLRDVEMSFWLILTEHAFAAPIKEYSRAEKFRDTTVNDYFSFFFTKYATKVLNTVKKY